MERTALANFYIKTSIYYKFIHCVFIKSTNDKEKFQIDFNNFCEKYKISKKDEIYNLLECIKNDENEAQKNICTDTYVIGYALLFIIYYLKNNKTILAYLSMMLLLMKATCNAKFKVDGMQLHEDDDGEELIEKTIDDFERIDTLLSLTSDIEKISKKMNDIDVYEIETNITLGNFIQFKLLSTSH